MNVVLQLSLFDEVRLHHNSDQMKTLTNSHSPIDYSKIQTP